MFEDILFVLGDYLVWLRRRTYLMLFTSACLVMVPFLFGKAVIDHTRGRGWFADPRGKPRLFQYGRDLMELVLGASLLQARPPTEEAYEAAKNSPTQGSGDGVTVTLMDDYLEFQPPHKPADGADHQTRVGVIIIPGAFISPFAYSILARSLANKGYPSFILRLPFGLAFYGWDTAGRIIKRPQGGDKPRAPTKWVLAGHSLGTMGVAKFVEARPDCVDGIVFMGGGNRTGGNVAKLDVPSLVIRGSRDPFTPEKEMQKSAHLLPKGTETCVVEGGNHRGFASYNRQPLDWEATITPEEQRRIVFAALTDFIERRVA